MVQIFCIEALHRSLQDVMQNNDIFRGKDIVMGGDFHQILLVLLKESGATIVDACINSSPLRKHCCLYTLMKNMRLSPSNDPITNKISEFSDWLLKIGDG